MGTIPKNILKGRVPGGLEPRQMQPADPAARRRALLAVAVAAFAGLALFGWLALETATISEFHGVDPEAASRQADDLFVGVT